MFIYFKEKELALNALSSSTDKTNLLKRYGDKYRLNVYDLTFKERSKFFYQFTKREYLDSFTIEKEDHLNIILFLDSHLKFAVSVYKELLSKFKDREDVVLFINRIETPVCLQLVFVSNDETDKERKYILKTVSEEHNLFIKKDIKVEHDGC